MDIRHVVNDNALKTIKNDEKKTGTRMRPEFFRTVIAMNLGME